MFGTSTSYLIKLKARYIEANGHYSDFPINYIIAVIMVGMCAGMIYNLHRKLTVDKEDIAASRKSLASLADSRDSLGPATPPSPPKSRASGRITQEVFNWTNGFSTFTDNNEMLLTCRI